MFAALSNETRRRILKFVSDKPRTAEEIVDALALRTSGVERHLEILGRAGFIVRRSQARKPVFSIAAPRGKLHAQLLICMETCEQPKAKATS
jgi:DNA-binding transcriptional ArsR family regulator